MSHTIEPVLEHERVAELRDAVRGEIFTAARRGLRRGRQDLERRARRPPAGA